MKDVIYRAVLMTGSLAPDGETPTELTVTEEVNCCIVWVSDYDILDTPLKVFPLDARNRAIEYAADRRLTPAAQIDVLIKEAKA